MRIACVATFLALTTSAFSANWESSGNPDIDAWYARAQREGGGSCCGKGDAYWAQLTKIQDDGVWVAVDDDRTIPGRLARDGQEFFVPNAMLDHQRQGNPTGHIVVFVGVADNLPICLFTGEGI